LAQAVRGKFLLVLVGQAQMALLHLSLVVPFHCQQPQVVAVVVFTILAAMVVQVVAVQVLVHMQVELVFRGRVLRAVMLFHRLIFQAAAAAVVLLLLVKALQMQFYLAETGGMAPAHIQLGLQ
jgi:hypothetical protein